MIRRVSALSALRLVELGLGLLRAGAADALDRAARNAGLGRDLGVLRLDDGLGGRIAFKAVKRRLRHAAVGALRAVLVHHVEQNEFADDLGTGFASHGAVP